MDQKQSMPPTFHQTEPFTSILVNPTKSFQDLENSSDNIGKLTQIRAFWFRPLTPMFHKTVFSALLELIIA